MAKKKIKLPISAKEANDAGMMVPEDARMTLERGLDDVQSRNRTINSNEITQKNKLEEIRVKLIQSLFSILKENGVDGSSLESINQFLQKLSNQDPDLAEMFELAFNNLLRPTDEITPPGVNIAPGTTAGTPPGTPPGTPGLGLPPIPGQGATNNAGLMDRFNNLAQQTFRPTA